MELTIDRTSLTLAPDQYYPDEHPKYRVILHFTAGTTAAGAVASWRADTVRVGTPYVIAPVGLVYQVFSPRSWAYALGLRMADPLRTWVEQSSLQIEMVNPGPLRVDGKGNLCYWPPVDPAGRPKFLTPYCKVEETHRYIKLDKPWRYESYFATFPEAQIDALVALVAQETALHNIPREIALVNLNDEVPEFFANWKGICTHSNFRPDKFDIGPAFPWQSFIERVKAA